MLSVAPVFFEPALFIRVLKFHSASLRNFRLLPLHPIWLFTGCWSVNNSARTFLTRATFEPVSDPVSIAIYHETACKVLSSTWLSPYQVRSLGSVKMSSSGQEQVETCQHFLTALVAGQSTSLSASAHMVLPHAPSEIPPWSSFADIIDVSVITLTSDDARVIGIFRPMAQVVSDSWLPIAGGPPDWTKNI